MNYIKVTDRDQYQLQCLNDYINEESEALVIDMLVDTLDLQSMGFIIGNNDDTGRARYDSKDLLKLMIYGFLNGIRSSRKLQKQAAVNKEVNWLLEGVCLKYRVITDLRKDNTDALKKVFEVL